MGRGDGTWGDPGRTRGAVVSISLLCVLLFFSANHILRFGAAVTLMGVFQEKKKSFNAYFKKNNFFDILT